jgi:proton-dependent oligopeptide transporter, POT family
LNAAIKRPKEYTLSSPQAILPGAANEKLFLGHPRGLFLLFMVEMWERFSYYGMRAMLTYYLVQSVTGDAKNGGFNPGRGLSEPDAYSLYGTYTSMVYLTPLLGGMIADHLIGTHRSMLVGGFLIALGHVVLGISGIGDMAHNDLGMSVFVSGLALIVIGTGHFKPNVSVMVGQLYPQNDPRRDGAFTIFYMGINLGALLGTLLCSWLGEKIGWHWGFGSAAIGMIIGLIIYSVFKQSWLGDVDAVPRKGAKIAPLFVIGGIVIAFVIGMLSYMGTFASIGKAFDQVTGTGYTSVAIYVTLTLLVLSWAAWFVSKQEPAYRAQTASILIFVLFNAVFWTAFEQAGSSMSIFALNNTERHVLGWEVPVGWFQSINPFLIIVFGPIFAIMWTKLGQRKLDPSQPMKIAIALFLGAAGFVFMVIGGMGTVGTAASVPSLLEGTASAGSAVSSVKVSMFWLLAAYSLHTWAELCISPTGLAFVTRAAAVKYVSFLMGIYFLSAAIAGKVAGMLAGQAEGIEKGTVGLPWYPWFKLGGQGDFYFIFVAALICAGLIVLALTPVLKRLIKNVK